MVPHGVLQRKLVVVRVAAQPARQQRIVGVVRALVEAALQQHAYHLCGVWPHGRVGQVRADATVIRAGLQTA